MNECHGVIGRIPDNVVNCVFENTMTGDVKEKGHVDNHRDLCLFLCLKIQLDSLINACQPIPKCLRLHTFCIKPRRCNDGVLQSLKPFESLA